VRFLMLLGGAFVKAPRADRPRSGPAQNSLRADKELWR
jgi:hypothetical protein